MLHGDYDAETVEAVIAAVCDLAGDHEPEDRRRAVEATAQNFADGQPVTGFPRLAEIIGDAAVRSLRTWLGIAGASGQPPLSDLGNGERFVHRYRDRVRFNHQVNAWFIYDGTRWAEDEVGVISELAKEVVLAIHDEAKAEPDEYRRKRIHSWAAASQNGRRIELMLDRAKTHPDIALSGREFDTDPGCSTAATAPSTCAPALSSRTARPICSPSGWRLPTTRGPLATVGAIPRRDDQR